METNTKVDVSCIIINYNTSQFTFNAVKSILESHNENSLTFEVIVVDNNSKPEDYKTLKKQLNTLNSQLITLVRSKFNTGFGGGNMLGVQHAKNCKYYAFINNDTLQVTPNCLVVLKKFMESTPDAAICSPQMLDEHKNFRATIDHFSSLQREILKRATLEFLFPKTYLNRKKTYKNPIKVQYVQGSFMFINAKYFNTVGGFDTNLFLYYEESDLSLRLLKTLKKYNYLVPQTEYIHYKSASINRNIAIKIEQKIALLYHTEKHYGWLSKKILNSYFIVRYFLTSIIKPKYWKLWLTLLAGAPISKSLKHKQKINFID
ncbi:glycosyltransferase family 2 protein [Seonamhaeicola algicola]|uniref:Glycosyltransferase family 2 protein n=1 Tax=Seonamhaeicola algicola TaxID=1719036 RepID=A0A5C7AGG9_9FLAO|nr:glycosyltransferase family 2 protein [Seonamhaeicola algicola]TXE07074.1 glycosyltransferase family 2 protein [Seonamhaeicola algicola]